MYVEGRLSLQSRPLYTPENLSSLFKESSGRRRRHFAESRPSVLANSMTPTCVRELSEDLGDRSEWLCLLETVAGYLATCSQFCALRKLYTVSLFRIVGNERFGMYLINLNRVEYSSEILRIFCCVSRRFAEPFNGERWNIELGYTFFLCS